MNTDLMFSSQDQSWTTPQWLFDALDKSFHFTLDPCCILESAKCAKFYTEQDDGLLQDWGDEIIFVNPPYSRELPKWVKKCHDQYIKNYNIVVMLIPARPETQYWFDYIWPKAKSICFIKGRLKFSGVLYNAPFPSALILFTNKIMFLNQELKDLGKWIWPNE